MLTAKRITLTLALALVVSLLTIVAVTINLGRTASAKPLKAELLRRYNKTKDKPNPAEKALLRKQVGLQDEPKEERTFKTRDFKDMPVAVSKVRNLDSDTWHKDLGIEVKNISTKPIYFIFAFLIFPDVPAPGNGVSGISLKFGDRKNIDLSRIADPEDPRLNPGETVVLTIAVQYRKGLQIKQERHPEMMKRFELHFATISFGDGTGFETESPTDTRIKKSHSSTRQVIQREPDLLRSQDLSQEERAFDDQIPKHLPI